jgi:hypothetical protein
MEFEMEAFEEVYNKSQIHNPRKIKEEVIRMFDGNDYRSFEEIYGKDSSLFEDVDDVIDPRKRKLFEEIYRNNNQIRLKEDNEDKQQLTENKEETFENKFELSEDRKADLKLKEDTFQEKYQTEKEELREEYNFDVLYNEELEESFNDNDDWGGLVDLKEEGPPGGYNFTGDESGPSGDGVPASHNKKGISGSDQATVQSGHDYSRNSKFFESIYEKTHEKVLDRLDKKLKKNYKKLIEGDDYDDEWDQMEDDD